MYDVSDLSLISAELRAVSRSATEIILPYQAAIEALRQLRTKRVAVLGWEGVIFSATGEVPFCPRVRGTPSIDRGSDEDWQTYVERSSEFCQRTMEAQREEFSTSPDARLGELLYCLVTLARPSNQRSGRKTIADRIKTEADALRIGLSTGIYTVADVIRWADRLIETRNAPHPAIFALSLAVNEPSANVVSRLFDVPGEAEHTEVLRFLLRDLHRRLDDDPSSAEWIAQSLYRLASSTDWPEDELGAEALYLDDAFELLRTSIYRGSHDDAVSDLREYLRKNGRL